MGVERLLQLSDKPVFCMQVRRTKDEWLNRRMPRRAKCFQHLLPRRPPCVRIGHNDRRLLAELLSEDLGREAPGAGTDFQAVRFRRRGQGFSQGWRFSC